MDQVNKRYRVPVHRITFEDHWENFYNAMKRINTLDCEEIVRMIH